ncbi:MAG: protein kinase domain-containing protein [Vicinamibacterales bacterium]
MSLAAGSRVGPYEITGSLGAGGMGEVYRARDARLERDVAIKLLPEAFAHDPDRLARFEREAKTLAALNHPNIGSIYGIEEAPGIRALILELVEGPTLADRIVEGPTPLDEALPIARQVAEAVEAAHDKGVIHRDLKPANIKLRPDGVVKVLDFGLAKALEGGRGSRSGPAGVDPADALSQSPTMTSPAMMTGIGVILGTAAYMAPEQARGRVVDRRADVWAFGCVLYEMLTGTRVFGGDDVTDTIAAVVRAEPDWNKLPPDTPASIRRLLRRCLHKDVRERLPDIGSARLEIKDAQIDPGEPPVPTLPAAAAVSVTSRRKRVAWTSALVLLTVAAATLGVWYWRESAVVPEPEMRVEISTPRTNDPRSFALSPDGRHLVFVAIGEDGQSRLWLRPLSAVSARELAGTEGAAYPFWSPDSRSVAFFAADKLKRIDIAGGPPQIITDASAGRGGTWNSDGVILFASFEQFEQGGNGLFRVAASGGERMMITKPRAGTDHRFPHFLPDGRRFLFFVRALTGGTGPASTEDALAEAGIYLGALESEETHRLISADTVGVYLRGDWLLFVRDGTLLVQRLDLSRQQLAGDPITLAENVHYEGGTLNVGAFSVSASGTVAYRTGGSVRRQLTWFDRSGKSVGTMGAVDENGLGPVELAPDGRRVATHRIILGNNDVWVVDSARTTRFTFDRNDDYYPIWSPDGQQIVLGSDRSGAEELYRQPSSGGGREEQLMELPPGFKIPMDFSPDGRFLMFQLFDPKTFSDLWILPFQGGGKPSPFVNTNFDERSSQFSPDGRWVSYVSSESGRNEVYARPFRGSGGQWQISIDGGVQPRWAPNGKELYYIAPDASLMAVPVVVTGDAIEPGTPVVLFQTRISNATGLVRMQYDVAPDGRFLINVATDQESLSAITLLLNWTPERRN